MRDTVLALSLSLLALSFGCADLGPGGGPEGSDDVIAGSSSPVLEADPAAPPAVQRRSGTTIEPVPVLEERTEEVEAAIQAQAAAARAVAEDPHAWMTRFKARASGPTALARVEWVSDEAATGGAEYVSTWRVHDVLAGPALPATVTLVQPAIDGSPPTCSTVRGAVGRVDVIIVELATAPGRYRLLGTGTGALSHMIPVEGGARYRLHMGPELAAAALVAEVSRGAFIDRTRGGQTDRVIERAGLTSVGRVAVAAPGRPS